MHRIQFLSIALLLSISLTTGCTGSNYPETYAVTGIVTYQGKAVEGASVVLSNMLPTGLSANGVTDSNGKFTVKTYMSPDYEPAGAVAGEYKIAIQKWKVVEFPPNLSTDEKMDYLNKLPPPKSLLPARYSDPHQSGFLVTVNQEAVTLNLDLVD
jgi:hypothetical protein